MDNVERVPYSFESLRSPSWHLRERDPSNLLLEESLNVCIHGADGVSQCAT